MKTIVPEGLLEGSWSVDFTPSMHCRQNYMYAQCMGSYNADTNYGIFQRKNLNSFLIISVLDGAGMLEYQGRETLLTKGMLAVIDCRSEHSYYCASKKGWSFKWLHFNGNCCINGYMEELSQAFLANSTKLADDLQTIMELMGGEQKSAMYELKCSNELIKFCMDFLYEAKCNPETEENKLLPVVKEAMRLFEKRFTGKVSLDDVCSELNISKFYFSRVFKEQMGVSPYEYLINLRIGYSKSLLRSSAYDILEIAQKAGFEDSSYFISVFRKREGITPLKYRKMFTG